MPATEQIPAILKGFLLPKLRAYAQTKQQLSRQHAEIASIMVRSRQTAIRVAGFTVTCVPEGTQTRTNLETLRRGGVDLALLDQAQETVPRKGYTQIVIPGEMIR